MHYTADNLYGSTTSVGFSNTWRVLAFADKASRDAHVSKNSPSDRSLRAIKRADISRYLDSPRPFSGEAVCLDAYAAELIDSEEILGVVCVATPDRYSGVRKLRA